MYPVPSYNVFLDFVMNDVASVNKVLNMSKDMTLVTHFSGDTTLVSTIFKKLQTATNELNEVCKNGVSKMLKNVRVCHMHGVNCG